jgi:hypothetical protein
MDLMKNSTNSDRLNQLQKHAKHQNKKNLIVFVMSHNRRNFLKTLGAVSAGAGLLSQGHLPLNPEVMDDENINFF